MPALPSLWPRSGSLAASLAARSRRRRAPRPTTMEGLLGRVIAAVNARGFCAAEVAQIAHLPASEIAAMATRCGCRDCFVRRAN